MGVMGRSSAAKSRRWILLATFSLLLVGAGCHTAMPGFDVPEPFNHQLVATFESQSETSGPFLALNAPQASTTNQFRASTDVLSGTNTRLTSLQGQRGTPYDFKTSTPLDRTYYLNVSVDVFGVVFVSNALAQAAAAAGQGLEAGTFRVEVRSGERLVGGAQVVHNAATSAGTWVRLPFMFRPEAAALKAGDVLSVRLVRYGGTADLLIGLGSSYQSYVEFRYFDSDPLAGPVYLEQGRLVTSGSDDVSTASFLDRAARFAQEPGFEELPQTVLILPVETEKPLAGPLLVGLALLPLVALGAPRRRPTPAFAVLLLFAASLSGCLSSDSDRLGTHLEDDEAPPKPTANVTYEEKPELKAAGKGEIRGVVQNDAGLPVGGGHVSLLGTNRFARTTNAGGFAFVNVTQGTYTLRIDAEKFLPFEEPVVVRAGQVTLLNVTLPYADAKGGNQKPHVHGNWGDQTTQVVQSFTFLPWTCAYATTCTGAPQLGQALGQWACTGLDELMVCETPLPINVRKPVPVGTGLLEVVLKWQPGSTGPKELGLRMSNSIVRGDPSLFLPQRLLPRPPGEPFRIAIFPNEADPGHQAFTNWQFWLQLPHSDLYAPASPSAYVGGPVNVEMIAHKGVVPFEPAHRDFWAGNDTANVLKQQRLPYSCLGCRMPAAAPGNDYSVPPGKGKFVPPGTKEIRGVMSWTNTVTGPTSLVEWNVWYKPANAPAADAASYLKKASGTRSGSQFAFVIPVPPEEADQFYQTASNWLFYPGDDHPDVDTVSAHGLIGYSTEFTFNADAIRDPSYTDT